MKRRLATFAAILLAAAAACLFIAASATSNDDAWNQITVGMNEAEVTAILGPGGNAGGRILVLYEEGRVVSKMRTPGSFLDRLKAWFGL